MTNVERAQELRAIAEMMFKAYDAADEAAVLDKLNEQKAQARADAWEAYGVANSAACRAEDIVIAERNKAYAAHLRELR